MEEDKGCPFYGKCNKRQDLELSLTNETAGEDFNEIRAMIEGSCKGYDYKKCIVYHLKLRRTLR